jgi:hypothetical protein
MSDIIVSSVFARIFLRTNDSNQYVGPAFMYEPMYWWGEAPPKFIRGRSKIFGYLPPEYEASISIPPKLVLSMREMIKDLRIIPIWVLEQRARDFKLIWSKLTMFGDVLEMQVGITQNEFEHLQIAFGSGIWQSEILITGL